MVKKKACIFISGSGTNLKSIIKSTRDYNFPINIELVISNKKTARGINYAKKYSIPYQIITNKKKFEHFAFRIIRLKKIEIICLAGFMKVLSKDFIRKFKGKIINIHPSLLPKFKGLDTFNRVLRAKEKFTGCTVHYVTSKLDSGNIIMQKKIKISENETEYSLKKRVLIQEHKLYPEAIRSLFK